MLNRLFCSFRSLVVVFAFILFVSNISFAAVKLSNEEKEVFKLSYSLGEASYLMPDLISNEGIMGIAIAQSKLIYLQRQALQQHSYIISLGLPKKTVDLSNKYQKEIQQALANSEYDRKKLLQAQKTYVNYSDRVRIETSERYGQKVTWLFDVGFLSGFTNVSMQSEYQNKLVLLQFKYLLDYIPYELPSSIMSAISNLADQKDVSLIASEIDLLKESAQSIAIFFNNPETYSPPATMKTLVGVWEGRLAEPGGSYHKANLKVFPDLSAELFVDDLFESMPVNEISLTQSIVSFDIKPFGEERLKIKFSGRVVDDMMAGDAVDISGKKGKWQFLRTSNKDKANLDNIEVVTDTRSLDKMVGIWKGKILEANGAISNSTLYFNLVDDSRLVIDDGKNVQELAIKEIAVNDEAIKFIINPEDNNNLCITFLGKVSDGIIEGNAIANDGSRGYWKLVKVNSINSSKSFSGNLKQSSYGNSSLCDPVVKDNIFDDIIFVSNESLAVPKDVEYKGYIVFSDGYKADLAMFVSGRETKLLLSSRDDWSKMLLLPENIKITPREISFTTYLDEKSESEVIFNGKIFGDYISGVAKNSNGEELNWELVAVNKAKQLIKDSNNVDISNIYGQWIGDANVQSFMRQPVEFNFSEESNSVKISDNEPVEIKNVSFDDNKISFIIPPNRYSKVVFVFNGTVDKKRLTGVFTSTLGLGFDVDLNLNKTLGKNKLSGLWIGEMQSGSAVADIIFDFTSAKKKVYIDDSNATSGRVELLISDLKNPGDKVVFNAKPKNSHLGVKFEGNILDKNISGFAFNDLQSSNKLTWSVSKSGLTEYLPAKIEAELSKINFDKVKKESFSFLDQMVEKNDKIQESSNSSDVKNKKSLMAEKEEADRSTLDVGPVSITDEDKYKRSEIEKSKKGLKNLEDKPEKLYKKDSKDTNNLVNLENQGNNKDQKSSTPLKQETLREDLSESVVIKDEKIINNSDNKTEEIDVGEKAEDYYGKWIGQLDNPDKGKGEIILDIKASESFMYVDKFGEKIPFKLFDLILNDKQISFIIKPSEGSDFGINFNGKLIQGVMSGDATDSMGSKGKWFAKKL